MAAHITSFIVKESAASDYFTAHLDNGSVRIGLLGCECFDFPVSHAEYARVASLVVDQIETAYDEFMGRYVCSGRA